MNGVLCCFQQYLSHITLTDHLVDVFPGFHQYYAGAVSVLPNDIPTKNPEDPVQLEPRTSE